MKRPTRKGPARRLRLVTAAVTAGIGLGVAWMFLSSGASAAVIQTPVTISLVGDSPLKKFAKLMPVITHPRCINCHGIVDPFGGANHPAGPIDADIARSVVDDFGDHNFQAEDFNGTCTTPGCHDSPDATAWGLAPKRVSFVGKTAGEICRLWQHSAGNSAESLKHHFDRDPLAANALNLGNKGSEDEPQEPPPMNKTQFIATANQWLQGHEDVPCAGWEGTITQTETVDLTTNHSRSGGGIQEHVTTVQKATRVMEITIGGDAIVRTMVQGTERYHTTIVTGDGAQSCTGTVEIVRVYGNPGGTSSAEARSAKVTFFPGGTYKLTIEGPQERTSKVETHKTTMCTLGPIPDMNDDQTFDHEPWTVEIEGTLPDPADQSHLEGSKTETFTDFDRAWLTASGGAVTPLQTRDNGELLPVPVEVRTEWDLRRTTDD